jgi:hypothetical protein
MKNGCVTLRRAAHEVDQLNRGVLARSSHAELVASVGAHGLRPAGRAWLA